MLFVSLTSLIIPKNFSASIDGLELRVDSLPEINLAQIQCFLQDSPLPVMLTLRKASQGGRFQGTEGERERTISELLSLRPLFFDLEGEMSPVFIRSAMNAHPQTRFVLSHHDFEKTPDNLDQIHRDLSQYSPFTCKIAAMANSTNDALRMLLFARNQPKTSAICMGEKGEFARVLGKVMGNQLDYAVLKGYEPTAPGQLSVEDLIDIYRYPSLTQDTAIYGLIGDPVAKSPGHLHHNAVFQKRNVKALYIKMIVKPEELEEFIGYAKELGIRGLSVTIPLKEKILPLVDELDDKTRQIGAVNTLRFQNGRIYGTNTDCDGALNAIEKQEKVKGKKVVLLGAGGAARGIAFEAHWRGANVVILNRTVARAKELAAAIKGQPGELEDVPSDADILINCSPDPMPIHPDKIPSQSLVMDIIISPRETPFLKEALQKGCRIVYGEEMFLNQAEEQTKFWLES